MNSGNEKMLQDYLLAHESDIALDLNDFGVLRGVFIEAFNRKPAEPERKKTFFGRDPQ